MSHMEDDDPPIKSHPASKEYRDNWDRVFGEKKACGICGATDHESVQMFGGTVTGCPEVPDGYMVALPETPAAKAVREHLASGGERSPIGWYGVFTVPAEPRVEEAGNTQIMEPGFVEACRAAEKPWERLKTGENTEDVADAPEKRPPSEPCDVCGTAAYTWCAPTCSECPDPNRPK